MSNFVERPKADQKKIHSKDQFELCYMRHQYLRRVNYNPTEKDMSPFLSLISNLAKNTYNTYQNLFKVVGFDLNDLINIAKIHLVSFLGLFSLEKQPEKYQIFLTKHKEKYKKEPQKDDVDNKNKANLTIFMKQRMEDVVRVCRQKARNIKGLPLEDFYVFYGPKKPTKNLEILIKDYEKLGFRKLDIASFKTIKKRQKIKDISKPFKFAGFWYITVPIDKRNLTLEDFSGADLNPYDNIHNKDPEQIMLENHKEKEFENKSMAFKAYSLSRRINIVRKFIKDNKKNSILREEVEIAREYVRKMRKQL